MYALHPARPARNALVSRLFLARLDLSQRPDLDPHPLPLRRRHRLLLSRFKIRRYAPPPPFRLDRLYAHP